MRCRNSAHQCVYALCPNHAIYSQEGLNGYFCYTHMMEDMKDGNWGRSWRNAGWYKERCRLKCYPEKVHNKWLNEWVAENKKKED